MNCQDFDRRLDALLDGACSAGEWGEAEAHLAGCSRCRTLFDGAAGRGSVLDEAAQASLTASIVRRTSGSPCESARARLGDLVDGALDPFDRELVTDHLSRCSSCAALAGALERCAAVLPSFAVLTPPPHLVAAVLGATSSRPVGPTFDERVAAWLRLAALRPRFSLEAAYVCTLLLALVFGDPVKAFKDTSAKGVAFAQPRVEVAVQTLARPLDAAREAGTTAVTGTLVRYRAAGAGSAGRADLVATSLGWWRAWVVQPVQWMMDAAAGWVRDAAETAGGLAERLLGQPQAEGKRDRTPRGAAR